MRRHNETLGIYTTYSFGKKDKTVRFILLDLKYDQEYWFSFTGDLPKDVEFKKIKNILI